MKLSKSEQAAYDMLVESGEALPIGELARAIYADRPRPHNWQESAQVIVRSLMLKSQAYKLPFKVVRTTPTGRGHVAKYQAVSAETAA